MIKNKQLGSGECQNKSGLLLINYKLQQAESKRMLALVAFLLVLGQSIKFDLVIQRPRLTQATMSFTMPFQKPFSKLPYFGFGVQSLYMESLQMSIEHLITRAELGIYTVQFQVKSDNNVFTSDNFIDLVAIWVYCPYIEIGIFELPNITSTVTFQQQRNWNFRTSYSLSVASMTFPLTYEINSQNNSGFTLKITQGPALISLKRYIMYFVVQKIFLAQKIGTVFTAITETNIYFISSYKSPIGYGINEENSFQPILQLSYISADVSLQKIAEYDCRSGDARCIKFGYLQTPTRLVTLRTALISFNPSYKTCPLHKFYAYSVPFSTFPYTCLPCDATCLTCTSADQDSTYTDYRYCTSCEDQRYVEPFGNMKSGICKCLKGLQVDSQGNCLPCQFNCLQFQIHWMQSGKSPQFAVIFSDASSNFTEDFGQNLEVAVDGNLISYQYENTSPGVFMTTFQIDDLSNCTVTCVLKFHFVRPENVQTKVQALTKPTVNLTLQKFFLANRDLPEQFSKAMTTITYVVAASTSSGQASLLKMLFELEQTIEVHKYLNLKLPVIFKDFVVSINNFRFMDVTTIIPGDIAGFFKNMSTSELDCKGHYKVVLFENGANFYKNIVPMIVSFFSIGLLNTVIVLLLYLIPTNWTRKIGKRLKNRWYVTLSQLLESLILPSGIFFGFQINYTTPMGKYLGIYIFAYAFCFFIVIYPLMILAATTKHPSQMDEDQLDRLEDLLQDCSLDTNFTYLFYLYGYWKKFIIGVVLASNFDGDDQTLILMSANGLHLMMIMFVIYKKMYKSIWKMIFRTGILLCIMILEGLMLVYNIDAFHSKDLRIRLGTVCFYICFIATGLGLAQFITKVLEFALHKIDYRFKCCPQFQKNSNYNYMGQMSKARLHKRSIIDIGNGTEDEDVDHEKQEEYKEAQKIRYKRRQNINLKTPVDKTEQEWSKFSESENKKETIQVKSQSSQIVDIDKFNFEQNPIYKRLKNKALRYNKKNQPQYDIKDRTASTKGQPKKLQQKTNSMLKTRTPDKVQKKMNGQGYRRNRIQRLHDDLKWKSVEEENQSSMSDIVEIP